MATYWVVTEYETRLAGRTDGWYVERRTNGDRRKLVNVLFDLKANADAEARKRNRKSSGGWRHAKALNSS